jgi:hypothetical protein
MDSFSAYMDVMIDLHNPGDSTPFTRSFHSELYSTQNEPGGGDHPIDLSLNPLYCTVIMPLTGQDEEPVIGSIYQCSGAFLDQDELSGGVRFSVLSSIR